MASAQTEESPVDSEAPSAGGGSPNTGTTATLLAWAPWVATAAGSGVLYADGLGTVLGMELRGPSLVVLVVAIVVWLGLRWRVARRRAARPFAALGLAVFTPILWSVGAAVDAETAGWLALAIGGAVALGVWGQSAIRRHGGSNRAGALGGFVVFGQAFDALTTAVGVDVLGYGEQNALSRAILSATEGFPLAGVTGTSWLFIAVKLVLAVAVVALFVDDGEESNENALIIAVAAFAGFGPAVHNVVLFATT